MKINAPNKDNAGYCPPEPIPIRQLAPHAIMKPDMTILFLPNNFEVIKDINPDTKTVKFINKGAIKDT
jgi:hypothetical protein